MEPLKTGLAGMAQLSSLLRNLPPSHDWDFSITGGPNDHDCGSYGCALGLMEAVWPTQVKEFAWRIGEVFKLPRGDLHPIFGMWEGGGLASHYGKSHAFVSPLDVANAIDAYIAKHQPVLPTLAIIITTPQKDARAAP